MEVFTAKSLIKDTLSLHIFKISEIEGYPIHTHEFVEIKYILEGEAVEYVGEQSYEVRRGDLLFIPYGVTHSFTGKKKFSYYNICFAPEVMAKRISTSPPKSVLSKIMGKFLRRFGTFWYKG